MANKLHIALAVLCSAVTTWSIAESADNQGSWLSRNLLSSSEGSGKDGKAAARVSDEPKSRFGLASFPSLPKPTLPKIQLPQWSSPSKRTPPKPSVWDKVNNSTKSFLTKTKQTLMPWANGKDDPKKARTSPTARRSPSPAAKTKSKETSKSMFPWLFGPKEEEKKIETVNDFLSLPHVPYE